MKLKHCQLGKIVRDKNEERYNRIGHIVGLGYNCSKKVVIKYGEKENIETIPLVKFPMEDIPILIHYNNLEELK